MFSAHFYAIYVIEKSIHRACFLCPSKESRERHKTVNIIKVSCLTSVYWSVLFNLNAALRRAAQRCNTTSPLYFCPLLVLAKLLSSCQISTGKEKKSTRFPSHHQMQHTAAREHKARFCHELKASELVTFIFNLCYFASEYFNSQQAHHPERSDDAVVWEEILTKWRAKYLPTGWGQIHMDQSLLY